MISLLLNVRVPEIYQQELMDTKSGIMFSVEITETNLEFSDTLVENFQTLNYNVSSNVLQPDFTKQFQIQVTVNPQYNSPVLAIKSILLTNAENNGNLGSSKTSSIVIDKNNVIVIGEFISNNNINPCVTCIDTSNSCAMYAKKNSNDPVQFLFSLTKINETFHLVLEDYKGTVDCNATIKNLKKLKNIPPGPDNCSSTLNCYDSNRFKKFSQCVNNLNTCLANNIDNLEINCFDSSGIVDAISCSKCLVRKNSSCGILNCCGSSCKSKADCTNKDCTSCVNGKCNQEAQVACDSVCSSNDGCTGASGGCTSCVDGKCTQVACGSSCKSKADCTNKDCTSCVNGKCNQEAQVACGSVCSSNDGCTGASGDCTSCVDGKCIKVACGSICSKSDDCRGASGDCTSCVNGKCNQESQVACGSVCSSNDGCRGAFGGCTSCVNEKCEKSKQSNVNVIILISILLSVVLAVLAIYFYQS